MSSAMYYAELCYPN